jgi:hypothetical protein
VAKEGSLVPQGWVSWVTANGSIGLVPKQGSVHLNLPPPEKVEGWSAASGADDASSSAPDSASARLGRNTYVPGRVTRAPSPRGGRTQLPDPRRAPPPPPVGAGGRSAPLAALSGALVARRGALGASFGAPSAPGGSRFGRSGSSFMGASGAPMEAPIGDGASSGGGASFFRACMDAMDAELLGAGAPLGRGAPGAEARKFLNSQKCVSWRAPQ